MTSILLGLLGAALGAAFFIAGFLFGRKTAPVKNAEPQAVEKYVPSEADLAEVEKQRERLRQDQQAFHELMGYSADVAYGVKAMPKG